MGEVTPENGSFSMESDPKYLNFKAVEVTEVDETKPWKPALKVKVTKADGSEEELDANTPFFTFKDAENRELTITAAAAGHVDSLHIKGTDAGSKFEHGTLEELCLDVQANLPAEVASDPGVSAFSMEMGKSMGQEGVSTMQELLDDGIISETDIAAAEAVREEVYALNKGSDPAANEAFVARFKEENPDNKVQFQVVRGAVVVPVVATAKRPTTELFMVFGPGVNGKTMYTMAPGRYMPKHPNPTQFTPEEGGAEGEAYQDSAKKWFDTVMLTG